MATKLEILKEIFEVEGVATTLAPCKSFTALELLNLICTPKYSLKSLDCTVSITTKWMKRCFPDRPSTPNRLDNYLLHKYGYKECKRCTLVLELNSSNFHKNIGTADGFNAYCCTCQNELTAVTATERQAKYKAAKLQRSPAWIDYQERTAIEEFYKNCPKGCHVDHIIPLQGELVSGLHVLSNLQYLTAEENMSKNNRYLPG